MRSTEGFYLVHRCIDDSWMKGDGYAQMILIKLIGWAKYRDVGKMVRVNGKFIPLKRGQLITSLKEIETATGFPKGKIERRIKWMSERETIEMQTGSSGTIITICNYDKYQTIKKSDGKQTGNKQETNGKQTGNEQEHKKEGNELNEGKNILPSTSVDSTYLPLAEKWLAFAKRKQHWDKKLDSRLTLFSAEIAKICQKLDMPVEELEKVLDFIETDDFWQDHAISPCGLLKISAKNRRRKIDNILTAYNKRKPMQASLHDLVKNAPAGFFDEDPF